MNKQNKPHQAPANQPGPQRNPDWQQQKGSPNPQKPKQPAPEKYHQKTQH